MSQALANASLTTLWNMSGPLHVMVIENSPADAERALRELGQAGFKCHPQFIATREEFLLHLARFSFDIVLADYRLPGWTGMDAFAAMREAGRDVPFILVTGILGEAIAVECIKQGVTDYVLKDHLSRLPLVVARALEERAQRDARNLMVEALRQSEASSLFLFAHNPLPMWVLESHTLQFLHVNDAALRQYGYDRIEFLQMTATALHPPEEVPELVEAIHEANSPGQHTGEWHHRKKNGSVIDVEVSMGRIEHAGRATVLAVAKDITSRKQAEEEKQKFFTLVENSQDFIAVADLEDNVQYVNPAGRALLGIADAESVRGTHSLDYVVPADLPLVHERILPALYKIGHWEGELRFRHRQSGKILPMDFVGFQVKDPKSGEPRFVATVSRDMTDRRALEQQLQHAQKFEAFGQLAGGIAHDFNNVVGAILGWAELGEEYAASRSDATVESYFKKIHVQCDRVTALIRQLLAFARRQILEPRSLSLNQTVQDVLNLLDKVIGKDIEIKTELAADLAPVRADPTQIEQVLMNLCINARDAMPKGGTIIIATRNAVFSQEDCRRAAGFQLGASPNCASRTPGPAWTPPRANGSSNLFSPPRERERAPVWDWPPCTASSSSTMDSFPWTANPARAAPFESSFRSVKPTSLPSFKRWPSRSSRSRAEMKPYCSPTTMTASGRWRIPSCGRRATKRCWPVMAKNPSQCSPRIATGSRWSCWTSSCPGEAVPKFTPRSGRSIRG
jgi:PAS domain S-box-containing protein